ncbi:NUDIX domain-containing protein [uncultured Clostridium sp.]|uniref:NUDIX hydrolase n=1 Tax=uncultured Clostridium sp. TaxID=59620 RepID=UPI0025F73BA9|nr:NUDIX domain-containing protein [uncultured Clostridium sp.]
MEEMIDIYNDNLKKTGVESRSDVHKFGYKHKVVQCYIIQKEDKEKWIYFQQRSFDKSNYPGLYDIACAGHISSGESPELSMVRELYEEVGIKADESDFIYAGRKFEEKNHDDILDDEICELYVLKISDDNSFKPGEEVEDIVKTSLDNYMLWISGTREELECFSLKHRRIVSLNDNNICGHIREHNKELMDSIIKV